MRFKLKELRLQQGFTIQELAQKSGVSHTTISNIENGIKIPKIDTYCQIARALGLKCYCELCDCPYHHNMDDANEGVDKMDN